MPTYQYACTSCGHQLEAVQSFSDAALTVCPACDGPLRKVFSAVGIVFKGSGFYRTDSRAAAKSGSAPTSTVAPSQTNGSSDSSSSSTSTSTSNSTSSTSSTSSSSSSDSGSGSKSSSAPSKSTASSPAA